MDIRKQSSILNQYLLLAYEVAVKSILSILIVFLLATMSWMVAKSILEFKAMLEWNIQVVANKVIINTLMTLALLEVIRTTLIYFSAGRVKVTYIIDTVLVVVLTEVMAFWFKEIEYLRLLMVIVLVLTLIVARIMAIRFSPRTENT